MVAGLAAGKGAVATVAGSEEAMADVVVEEKTAEAGWVASWATGLVTGWVVDWVVAKVAAKAAAGWAAG